MAKVLVLYYSMYGHIETMARAVAEGASKVDGAEVVVKRVPETMPPQLFEKAGGKTDVYKRQAQPFDAVIFHGDSDQLRALCEAVAARDGAIVSVQGFARGEDVYKRQRLACTVSVQLTARKPPIKV